MAVTWDKTRQRWVIEVYRGGRRVLRKSAPKGATREDAEAFEAQIVLGAFRADLGKRPDYTIEQGLTRWVQEDVEHMKSYRATCLHVEQLLPFIKGRLMTDIPQVAEEYTTRHKHLAPATVYQRLAVLRRIANLAYRRWDWLDQPLGQKIRMPRVNNARHTYPDYQEVLRLLIAAPNQGLEDAILLAYYTGMRRGEILKLQLADVHDDVFTLLDTKNSRPRMVPIHPALDDVIFRLPLPYRHPDSLTAAFAECADSVGLGHIRFHDLRHGAAAAMIQRDVDLHTVGAVLGHANLKTTQRYAHLSVDNLRTAIRKIGG